MDRNEHFYDAAYQIWMRGGNPDRLSFDRAEQDWYNGKEPDYTAQIEINRQRKPQDEAEEGGSASTKRCWNCKHRTHAFKIGKLTHYHCASPTYEKQHKEGVAISPWETLRVFSDSCDEHELRS